MHLLPELNSAVQRLAQARALVEEILEQRDRIIVDMIHHGISKKTIAERAEVAPVSVYKILTRHKERESVCP
jgi:hypothetical protein